MFAKRNFMYFYSALFTLVISLIIGLLFNERVTSPHQQQDLTHDGNSGVNQIAEHAGNISASRKRMEEVTDSEKKDILHFFESISNSDHLSNEDWNKQDHLAELLAKNDPELGMEVLRIVNSSANQSLKFNFCAKYIMNLRSENIIGFYKYVKDNPFIINDLGSEFNFRENICTRIFNLNQVELTGLSNDFFHVEDAIISNAIMERRSNIAKFEEIRQQIGDREK